MKKPIRRALLRSIAIRRCRPLVTIVAASVCIATIAAGQDRGTVGGRILPELTNPNDPKIGARELFARRLLPSREPAKVHGFYAKGCISGAAALPLDGPTWQVMRISRNRYFAHPQLVALIERVSRKANDIAGWPGLLVGDMSQPRGGPMLTGHASHQIGLDADIWLTPMPSRTLTRAEREEMSAVMMVRKDRLDIDPQTWTASHLPVIRAAAQEESVERIFVNAAIKKALCREAKGNRDWLSKVRPMYGHDYHFHIRLRCPSGNSECTPQPPPGDGDGCGDELAYWFSDAVLHPKPPLVPPKPKPPMTLADLPAACRQVLAAP